MRSMAMPSLSHHTESFDRLNRDMGLENGTPLSVLIALMCQHPMINLEIVATDDLSNLAWREADVVIRITQNPPDSAFGRKLADSPLAIYASKEYLGARPKRDRWIAYDYKPALRPAIPARIVANAGTLALAAQMIQMGRGIGALPCFMGDTNPTLRRVEEVDIIPDMQIWVLTHEGLRTNPRVRALMDHLYKAFDECRPIIEGRRPFAIN